MRLIDADEFKKQLENAYEYTELAEVIEMLDNAPTVEPCKDCEDRKQAEYIRHSSSWHELQALRKFKEEHDRPQGDITEEDIQNAIKAGYENGYSMAQAKYQRPQGEWIKQFGKSYELITDEGTLIGEFTKCPKCLYDKARGSNFCPNCGAQMVKNDG